MPIRKLARMLFLVNGLQLLLGAGILLGLYTKTIEYSEEILYLSVSFVLLSSLLSIAGLFSVLRYQNKSFEQSMENLERLNVKLREQRHDYLNQIQVVYGLLELEEYQEARNYLRPVFKDILKVNQALRTAQPAVNALLQAKLEAAEKQGIDFYLEVGTQLKELQIEPWELCKVLANLIDNAAAAVGLIEGERRITLRLEEDRDTYRILVQNNGPAIPPERQKLIFARGYTTKKEEGHGMGLAIVTEVLKEAGGSICLTSEEEETTFSVVLPKQKSKKAGRGVRWHSR